MNDFDMPSCFIEKYRAARKEHKCCECHSVVSKGEKYLYSSRVWDGQPDSFKTCLSCESLRKSYQSSCDELVAFKELRECIESFFCKSYSIDNYVSDFPNQKEQVYKLFGVAKKNET